MLRERWSLLVPLLGLVLVALQAAPAHACSWLGAAIRSSSPESGDRDVPIDVAPIIRGYWTIDSIAWETLDGQAVEFHLSSGPSAMFTEGDAAELVPRTALAPNTTYVIRAQMSHAGSVEERVEFTTGGQATEARKLAPPRLATGFLTGAANTCTPGDVVGCVSVGDHTSLLELLDSEGTLLTRDVIRGDATVYPGMLPDCVRARTRDAAGRLSAATESCALASRPIQQGEPQLGLVCEGGKLSATDEVASDAGAPDASEGTVVTSNGGCSAARSRGRSDTLGALALLGLAGVWLAARSRRRSALTSQATGLAASSSGAPSS